MFVIGLCSADVFTGSGVDLDFVAFVDEERNFNLRAGFNGCRFGNVGCGIAFNAGVGFGYFKSYEVRSFKTENFAFVRKNTANVFFFAEFEGIAEKSFFDRDKFIGIGIHEVIKVAVGVAVAHFFSLDKCGGEFIGRVESALNNCAGNDVSDFGTDESRAFAGFYVLEFDDLINITVIVKSNTVSEIACRNHKLNLLK